MWLWSLAGCIRSDIRQPSRNKETQVSVLWELHHGQESQRILYDEIGTRCWYELWLNYIFQITRKVENSKLSFFSYSIPQLRRYSSRCLYYSAIISWLQQLQWKKLPGDHKKSRQLWKLLGFLFNSYLRNTSMHKWSQLHPLRRGDLRMHYLISS